MSIANSKHARSPQWPQHPQHAPPSRRSGLAATAASTLPRHSTTSPTSRSLIPPRRFVHNVAAWRALVEPEWLDRIFLPYEHLLTHGRFLRDRSRGRRRSPRHACIGPGARSGLPRARQRIVLSVPGEDRGARHRVRPRTPARRARGAAICRPGADRRRRSGRPRARRRDQGLLSRQAGHARGRVRGHTSPAPTTSRCATSCAANSTHSASSCASEAR